MYPSNLLFLGNWSPRERHPKPQSRSLTGETTIRNHSGSRGRPNATTSAWGEKVSSEVRQFCRCVALDCLSFLILTKHSCSDSKRFSRCAAVSYLVLFKTNLFGCQRIWLVRRFALFSTLAEESCSDARRFLVQVQVKVCRVAFMRVLLP